MFPDVGCFGCISDGGVLRNIVFYHALEAKQLNIPEPKLLPVNDAIEEEWDTLVPHYFVGDDAFSLTENVMKPYAKRAISEEQRVLNYRLSRARRVSENAFGILSAKFRIFHSTLYVKPKNAISIVHSRLALHNFLIKKCPTVYTTPGSLDYENENGEVIAGEWRQTGDNTFENLALPGMNHTRSASQMRGYLSEYINGPGRFPGNGKFFYLRNSLLFSDCNKSKVKPKNIFK